MIEITDVVTFTGVKRDFILPSREEKVIDGSKLLVLPGLIDPHVHFRVPGMEDKEDWGHGSRAAFKGGYTTVFDMPNTKPTTTTKERLIDKFNIINKQISESGLPMRYKLFFGADKNNFQEIVKVKDQIVGIKVFMGASTGELLMDDESSLHAIYAIASKFNLTIALHAEDEMIIRHNSALYDKETNFKYHSIIRSPEAAVKAVELVIKLSRIYGVRSYILHLSTKAELDLVRAAKLEGVPIYAETCPHYLFLDDSMYDRLNGFAKMNPPLRNKIEQEHIWDAINDGTIDTIGSDHAPHSITDKNQPLCKCPSGVPGIETSLPLMLTAYKEGRVSLKTLVRLMHDNPRQMFNVEANNDLVFANIEDYHPLSNEQLCTKAKWSPYAGMNLTGYPEYLHVAGHLYELKKIKS
jgi:dihydroorotase